MGEIKNLNDSEGIKKLRVLADGIKVCMFCTPSKDLTFETRPMGTQQVDEDGNFWFFSASDSNKNDEIMSQSRVQLIYSNISAAQFLTVTGRATISRDKKKIDELWDKMAQAWFKDGKEDPNLTLICVKPEEAYYWDTVNGKMITLLKIAISAVSGKQMDGGVEGKILI